jgi:hypothetical protein
LKIIWNIEKESWARFTATVCSDMLNQAQAHPTHEVTQAKPSSACP